ncbi:NADP-dependent oxidoreductase [Dysgonomonas sp. HDW5A]|uniref:NADP-dependent oxidoreductase n=1 Tax=Dysgonomonas sp. HDW5A TaxID=2714926 RepID=UPI00140C2848|nr:NADP-dependent oxidoreductase [Dysgonomonas sp. HDW5A]QIK60269.1 NADP-dependent oxidoreductase [Dysgonomonas sp. HDW5A]
MKAITLKEFGSVDNLIIQDIPTPTIKEDEVLVKVKAISINPVDVKVRAGGVQIAGPLLDSLINENPIILGWDISGEITETGTSVHDFKVGDEVFGMVNFIGHGKAYAEYVAVPASQLALKPQNISYEEAAAATLAVLTAWQAFTKDGHLKSGDRVLIHAASGGVGHYAVQIAKHLGAYVIGTSSAANKDFVMSLGADEHIDYKRQDFEKTVSEIDFVLETIGGKNLEKSLEVVKQSGTVIIINLPSGFSEEIKSKIIEKGIKFCLYMTVQSSGEDMKQIANLLEKGIIKSHISKVFSFDQMAGAHLQIESGRTMGKTVVIL